MERLARRLIPVDDVRAALLARKMAGAEVEVTEDDVRQAYRQLYGERLDVRRIIVGDEAEAEDIRRQLDRGASFDALMRTRSAEPHLWLTNGLVRGITAGHPYYEHVKDLTVGEVSDLFQRSGHWCLLKLLARHPAEDPPPLDRVRAEMARRARERKVQRRVIAWLEKLKAEAVVEVNL